MIHDNVSSGLVPQTWIVSMNLEFAETTDYKLVFLFPRILAFPAGKGVDTG